MTNERAPPQHTPEPWINEGPGETGDILITDEQGVTITTCWKQPHDPSEWVENNAWLIATAPKLLRGAEAVVSAWESGDLAAAVRELDNICAEARGLS